MLEEFGTRESLFSIYEDARAFVAMSTSVCLIILTAKQMNQYEALFKINLYLELRPVPDVRCQFSIHSSVGI